MTIFSVMRRPRWIGALVLALVIAGIFAALGQWQLERAVTSNGPGPSATTEVVTPLAQVAKPGQPVYESQDGQMVEVSGRYVAPDFTVVSTRLNGGVSGYWVVGRFDTSDPGAGASITSVAVALGWTADRQNAISTADSLNSQTTFDTENLTGRYVGADGPEIKDAENKSSGDVEMSTMSVAFLINEWRDFPDTASVYGGYVVASDPVAGLTAIDSPEPQRTTELNWLNIFYAVEWVIFAGFAIFFWFRLVKDAWERELEEAEDEQELTPVAPADGR